MSEWERRTAAIMVKNRKEKPYIVWDEGRFFACGIWAEPMLEEWERGDRPAPAFGPQVTFVISDADRERWPDIDFVHPGGIVTLVPGPTEVRELNKWHPLYGDGERGPPGTAT